MPNARTVEGCKDHLTEDLVPQAELRGNVSRADHQGGPSRNSVVICQAVGRSIFTSSTSSAAERVSLMLKQEEEGEEEASHPVLFIQLSELFSTLEGLEWRETAR